MTTAEDLARCCCDAPTLLQRQRADYLAGFELLFRINTVDTTVDASAFSMDAEVDYARALSGDVGGALPIKFGLFTAYDRSQFRCRGGERRANTYWFCRNDWNGQLGGGAVGYGRRLKTDPGYARSQLLARAEPLIAEVKAARGEAAFSSERRLVYTGNLVNGESPLLYECLGTAAGPFVRAAGSYTVELSMDVLSPHDESNPATVSFGIAVDGEVVATATGSRASYYLNPATLRPTTILLPPGQVDDVARLETSNAITLSASGEITIVNVNALGQRAYGVVRVFTV